MSSEPKCPFAGHSPSNTRAGGRGNRDWWPEQLNLSILHQHSAKSDPMGEDFDYAREFKTLDLDAVVRDLTALMTVLVWRRYSNVLTSKLLLLSRRTRVRCRFPYGRHP